MQRKQAILVLLVLIAGPILTPSAWGQPQEEAAPFDPPPLRFVPEDGEGRVSLSPSSFLPAAIGTYTLRFKVGPSGIAEGGGIRVAFPKAWFTNPFPLPKELQQTDPEAPHHVGVTSSTKSTQLSLEIDQVGLTGKNERFNRTLTAQVSGTALEEKDTITVTLANTTAPYVAGIDFVTVAVDESGNGQFKKLADGARYEVLPGAAEEMILAGPSQAVVGHPAQLHITAVDRFFNRVDTFVGFVQITGLDEPMVV